MQTLAGSLGIITPQVSHLGSLFWPSACDHLRKAYKALGNQGQEGILRFLVDLTATMRELLDRCGGNDN